MKNPQDNTETPTRPWRLPTARLRQFAEKYRKFCRDERGMTLIEIMIVLAIMAAVMGGVLAGIMPALKRSKINQAKMGGGTVQTYAIMYAEENRGDSPSVQQLVDQGFLQEQQAQDPWNNAYAIEGDGNSLAVVSAGPDGTMGNDDDVKVGGEER